MRRLEACKDILKWETIPAITLNLESILAGEYAENEFRKQFTASERAAIGAAIEQELGDRRGQHSTKDNVAAIAANSEQGKSADIAAKRAGFASAETFERAKAVVARGTPEVIRAMDAGYRTGGKRNRKALTEGERARTFESSKRVKEKAQQVREILANNSPKRSGLKGGRPSNPASTRAVADALAIDRADVARAEQQVDLAERYTWLPNQPTLARIGGPRCRKASPDARTRRWGWGGR
jgi:hypothetical protein